MLGKSAARTSTGFGAAASSATTPLGARKNPSLIPEVKRRGAVLRRPKIGQSIVSAIWRRPEMPVKIPARRDGVGLYGCRDCERASVRFWKSLPCSTIEPPPYLYAMSVDHHAYSQLPRRKFLSLMAASGAAITLGAKGQENDSSDAITELRNALESAGYDFGRPGEIIAVISDTHISLNP